MQTSSLKLIPFILLLLFFQAAYSQQQPDLKNRWSPEIDKITGYKSSFVVGLLDEDEKKMKILWNEIGEELKTNQKDLTGTYVNLGYESGYFLRLSNARYMLISYYDQNLVNDFSYGKIDFINDSEIIFRPERESTYSRFFKKMPLKWVFDGGSIMPVEKLKDFGLYLAGLGKYNDYNGQCCDFTPAFSNHKVEGKTVNAGLPEKYKRFLVSPITGTIIFVGKKRIVKEWGYDGHLYSQALGRTALIPVKINVGSKQRVKKNMLFTLLEETDYIRQQYLQILNVKKSYSEGVIVREFSYEGKEVYHDYENDQDKPFPPVKKGIKASTTPF